MMEGSIAYDRKELNQIFKAFKAMDDEATKVAQETGYELAKLVSEEVKKTAYERTVNPKAVRRIADGVRVSKTSKVGEASYGFATQRFSGGGTTRKLWGGFEFGSNKRKQFPNWSGRFGKGSRGWFIYPTLRKLQPELVKRWEAKFNDILKEWGKN